MGGITTNERNFSAVVNLALPKYRSTRASQAKLPAVGLGMEDYLGSAVNPGNWMDCGIAHTITT